MFWSEQEFFVGRCQEIERSRTSVTKPSQPRAHRPGLYRNLLALLDRINPIHFDRLALCRGLQTRVRELECRIIAETEPLRRPAATNRSVRSFVTQDSSRRANGGLAVRPHWPQHRTT